MAKLKQKKFNYKALYKKVKAHLLKQNKRSEMDFDCRYRIKHPDGNLHCAIGILISDEAYKRSFEGKSVKEEKVFNALEFKVSSQDHVDFLYDLEQLHDQFEVKEWKKQLDLFEKKYLDKLK